MSQQCNHTDFANCPTCTSQPPFKKGDWIAAIPGSVDFLGYLHQAVEDPQKSLTMSSGWQYRAPIYSRNVCTSHFQLATKADLMKEHARLYGELDKLQARMSELLSAAEGLS